MTSSPATPQIQIWQIDRLIFYARNPRKNDVAAGRMWASIREFGFTIPALARSDEPRWTAAYALRPRASWNLGQAAIKPAFP